MSVSADSFDAVGPERRLSGATLVVLAFVMGTLFALLPMYYVYTSRDSATRADFTAESSIALPAPDSAAAGASSPSRFAARMTYELSHTPTERPVAPMRVTAKTDPPGPKRELLAQAAPTPRTEPVARVQNAKPIIAAPPEPRDTTREMEREARRPDYREPPRQLAQVTGESVQPKVIEGRDFVFPGKTVTTRTISVAEPEPKRAAEIASGTPPASPGTMIPGASPIGPPPEANPQPQPQKAKADAAKAEALKGKSENSAGSAGGDVLSARLGATREWLAASAQTTHTIQILGSNSEEHLRHRLKALTKVLDESKIYVFRTVAQGKPAMTVIYGAYADRRAALQALEKLPEAITVNRPMLRTVNGIRAEQKQHGLDS